MRSRFPWLLVGFLWFAFLLNFVDRQLVFSIFPVLKKELGLSDAQLGLVGSLFLWTYCLCMAPAGRLADVVPKQRMILSSLVLWSLATLGTALSQSAGAVLFCRVLMGITEALYLPAALGLIGMLHPGSTRSTAFSVHGTAQVAGIVFGGWYGGWMADHFGWRTGFLILAVCGIAYAFVLAPVLGRLSNSGPDRKAGVIEAVASRPAGIFKSRCYVTLIVGFVSFGIMLWILYAWLPTFIYERYRLTMGQSGLIATLYLQSSAAVGLLAGGALADRLVKRVRAARFYIVVVGLLFSAPFAYLTLAVHSLSLMKLFAAGFGLFAGLVLFNVFAAAYDVTAKRNYGFATGVLNSFPGYVSGTAIFLAGALKESVGILKLMQWGALGATLMAVVLLAVVIRNFDREHSRIAESVSIYSGRQDAV
jgi:MFS family permease